MAIDEGHGQAQGMWAGDDEHRDDALDGKRGVAPSATHTTNVTPPAPIAMIVSRMPPDRPAPARANGTFCACSTSRMMFGERGLFTRSA